MASLAQSYFVVYKFLDIGNLCLILCFIIQEYLVPQEYVLIMRESMLNKCPVSSYQQVCEVFKKELGDTPDKVCTLKPVLCG